MSDRVLFIVAPYVAALVFVVGFVGALGRRADIRGPAMRSELLRRTRTAAERGSLFRGRRVGVAALVAVLAAHLVMWGAPGMLIGWDQSVMRVAVLEVAMFGLAIVAGVGLVRVIVAGVRGRVGERGRVSVADLVLLGVLTVGVASGLALSVRYRWASSWSAVTLTPYVRSLVGLSPDARLLALPYLVKLHVFSGIALLAVLPFSSVMRRLVAPVHWLIGLVGDRFVGPVVGVVARQSKRIGEWANTSGRAIVWPEEED